MAIERFTTIPTATRALRKGEEVTMVTVLKKGWHGTKKFTLNLSASCATFQWFIFVFGFDNSAFSLDLSINHRAPDTVSRIYARSVLHDSASVRCSATSTIYPNAHHADTYLSFRTLLLSPNAHTRTVPSLEILTKDVTAGHAASVERFSQQDLFYLQTRGIDERSARNVLTQSFLSADLLHLADTKQRSILTRTIATYAQQI